LSYPRGKQRASFDGGPDSGQRPSSAKAKSYPLGTVHRFESRYGDRGMTIELSIFLGSVANSIVCTRRNGA
jgi:hypothetical protein